MKKNEGLIALSLLGGFALMSCQNSTQAIATPEPTVETARVSGKPFTKLKRGHGIYLKQCAQCHEHRLPNTVSLPAWHSKIGTMSEIAGLSREEQDDLQSYLSEFSDR